MKTYHHRPPDFRTGPAGNGHPQARRPRPQWLSDARTILLVEDEDFVREVTGQVLHAAGYRVLMARNACEAAQIFHEHACEIQLLLTDVIMPGKNGKLLAEELRAICPTLRTILMSGYPEAPGRATDRNTFYLSKPFSMEMLTDRIGEVFTQAVEEEAKVRQCAAGGQ